MRARRATDRIRVCITSRSRRTASPIEESPGPFQRESYRRPKSTAPRFRYAVKDDLGRGWLGKLVPLPLWVAISG
jgi:hypothetical protein